MWKCPEGVTWPGAAVDTWIARTVLPPFPIRSATWRALWTSTCLYTRDHGIGRWSVLWRRRSVAGPATPSRVSRIQPWNAMTAWLVRAL